MSSPLFFFWALYYNSLKELCKSTICKDDNIEELINQIRNDIKLLSKNLIKIENKISQIDETATNFFENKVELFSDENSTTSNNLGIWFDENNHIIFCSYSLYYFMENDRAVPYTLGFRLSSGAIEMMELLGVEGNTELAEYLQKSINIAYSFSNFKYLEIDTNDKDIFVNSVNKDINLIALVITSYIGFVQHELSSMLIWNCPYLTRIRYIIMYYSRFGMIKIRNYFQKINKKSYNEKITELEHDLTKIIKKGKNLISPEFRNCMMHYGFINKKTNKPAIKLEYFCKTKPFYGLVESCFDGKSFEEYAIDLSRYLDEIEAYLLSWFNIDESKLKIL